jgi:hypothetical protein
MKRLVVLLACLLLSSPTLAQSGHGWRMYPFAKSTEQRNVHSISSDQAGGMWLGYQAVGGISPTPGGLTHLFSDGSTQQIANDLLSACPSVNALAMAADQTLWLRLSGTAYEGTNDYWENCNYGVQGKDKRFVQTLGYMSSTGEFTMLSKAELPNLAPNVQNHENQTLVIDAKSRPWIGTANGVAARNSDGTWQEFALWSSPTTALAISTDQQTIIAASMHGDIATISADGRVTTLAPLAETPLYLAIGSNNIWASTNGGVYLLKNGTWLKINNSLYAIPITIKDDQAWLGYANELVVQQAETVLQRYTPQNSYLPLGGISSLAWLNNNTLAIGSNLGVSSLDTSQNTFVNASREILATERLWQSTNRNSANSWVWGPVRWAEQFEPYREAPNGARYVAYFDKTRMEVTQPDADSNQQWYITNGLLVQEMVTGNAQYADQTSISDCPKVANYGRSCPSLQRVVGDPENNNAPWYGEFDTYLPAENSRIGERISQTLFVPPERTVHYLIDHPENATPETTIVYFDQTKGHNIPQIFFDYLQQQPQDWLYMFGHPITEAYWTEATVGGQKKLVLVQLFERRSLSYTPDNPAEWRVEMGNVGQHYYQWRYDQTPWDQ